MKLSAFVSVVFASVLAPFAGSAGAQDYPNRPIRLVQGFAPGGNADVIGRILGQEMSRGLGQPVIVEAKPGAGGTIGSDYVAKAAPDGYTLLLVTGGHSVSGALYRSLAYDPVKSFDMISMLSRVQFVVVVRSDSKEQTMPGLLALARTKPESVTFGSAGVGSTQHLTGELLSYMAGLKLMHVPYKGDALAIGGLLGGETASVVAPVTAALAHLKAGKVKAVAVTGKSRWGKMPDVPTVEEAGVAGFDVRSYMGIAGPAGMPRALVDRLNAEVQRDLRVQEVRAKLEELGGEVQGSTPEEMRQVVAADLQRWTAIVKVAKIPQQ